MRDGDGDGKCQEEDGKWVPCPPGVASGTRLRNGKPLGQTLAEIAQTSKPQQVASAPAGGMSQREQELWRQPRQPRFDTWLDLAIEEGVLPPPPEPDQFNNDRDWVDERNAWEKRAFSKFEERLRADEERRENDPDQPLTVEQQFPEAYNDEGDLKPELIDEYIQEHRRKAAQVASEVAKNQRNVDSYSLDAAEEIYRSGLLDPDGSMLADRLGRDEADFENEYEKDNPPPDIDDFYTDYDDEDEAEEAYADAMQEWKDDRDTFVRDSLIDQEASQQSADSDAEDLFIRAFAHDRIEGKSGAIFSAEVTYVEDNYDGSFSVTGNILAPDGRVAAQFVRVIGYGGPERVKHDRLIVTPQYQGEGIASSFNAMNEAVYKAMGISEIETNGVSTRDGKWSGASHWPRNGFNWANSSEKKSFLRIVQRAVESQQDNLFENELEREILREMITAALASPMGSDDFVAGDFVRWKGATAWFHSQSANLNFVREI